MRIDPPAADTNIPQSGAIRESLHDTQLQTESTNLELEFGPRPGEHPAAAPPQAPKSTTWRQELSERVQSFRQRRARLRNDPGQMENLDFELDRGETEEPLEPGVEKTLEFPRNAVSIDAEIAPDAALENEEGFSDAEAPEEGGEKIEILDSAPPHHEKAVIDAGLRANNPLEILVEPSDDGAPEPEDSSEVQMLIVAAMGRRFLAGLVDGLALLLACGLFALIFWRAGGHLTPGPLNLAIGAFIATIFVWAYFGSFTALTFSTPGQTWMGIEVRNMEGHPPAPRESLLRAFGYLVSLSALMIGFLWALVDSDGLTWHDRISGTFLTPVKEEAAGESEDSEP